MNLFSFDRRWLLFLYVFFVILVSTFWAIRASADTLDAYLFSNNEELSSRMHSYLPRPPAGYWIEDPELRISPEVDARDTFTETYSLRFRPTSRKERRTVRKLFDIESELTSAEWNKSLSEALAKRYKQVIDLAEQEVVTASVRRHLALDRFFLASEQALSATSKFSASRLQKAALRLELREQEVQRVAQKTGELRSATISDYLIVSKDGEPKVSRRLIQPEMIGTVLESISAAPASTSFDNTLAKLEVRRAQQEMALENSRTGFGLSLMELSYENKGIDSYNMTFGFRLPFARRTRGSQQRVRELVTAEQQALLNEQILAEAVQNAVREMRWQIDAYAANEAALQSLSARLQFSSADVSALMVLRRHQLELFESAANTHLRLLQDFVELLDLVGLLQQRPLRNWIGGESS